MTFERRPSAYERRWEARMAAQGKDKKGRPLGSAPATPKPISFDGAPSSLRDPSQMPGQPQPVQYDPMPERTATTGIIGGMTFQRSDYEIFD